MSAAFKAAGIAAVILIHTIKIFAMATFTTISGCVECNNEFE